MTDDLERARMNPRRRSPTGQSRPFGGATLLLACSITAFFAGPARANAGELSAPPPTLPEQAAPTGGADAPGNPPAPAASAGQTSAPAMSAGSAASAGSVGPVAPAPRVDDDLSLLGTVLWEGLKDQRVSLTLVNGATIGGTIVAQSHSDLALARRSDGTVVSVPKAEVVGVRSRGVPRNDSGSIANRPVDSGRSLYGAGVAMLGFGVPLGLSAALGASSGWWRAIQRDLRNRLCWQYNPA